MGSSLRPPSDRNRLYGPFLTIRGRLRLGQEMQHDTSPHDVEIGGGLRSVQTASLVLCFSRMLFFQCYPPFTRFDCKVFLTDALRYLGGAQPRHDR